MMLLHSQQILSKLEVLPPLPEEMSMKVSAGRKARSQAQSLSLAGLSVPKLAS